MFLCIGEEGILAPSYGIESSDAHSILILK